MNFTVEMETGTGKTYTYLRTIFELNRVYGFKKFVIVVPSIAIREGTFKNLEITRDHFQALYTNQPCRYWMYDSKRLTDLRTFATADSIQILVINIDSFARDTTIINTDRENGIRPLKYIQETKPIVIVDEPQNMETEVRRNAIESLNPLCTLRYSATHRNFYNLIYRLDPVQAYDLGLVKQIEVDSIEADQNYNSAYIHFESIHQTKTKIQAKLRIHVNDGSGVKAKSIKAETGDSLYILSGHRDIYQDGYILNRISADEGWIEFSNGLILRKGDIQGGLTELVLKYQMERAIEAHFEKEVRYWKGALGHPPIKVLTLFFVDKVSNYRELENGSAIKGKFALWFEEIFERHIAKNRSLYPDLFTAPLPEDWENPTKVHETDIPKLHPNYWNKSSVHNGYFSQDKTGALKDTKGSTRDDEDTYSLIMRDKERLLSFDEPLRFIFSHTALREGWDNPNVFQICTLNETKSELRKRQEIGRGLRLAVDKNGLRVRDRRINVLTVIANESYHDFAGQLQKEIEEETSISFEGRIRNAREKALIRRSKELTVENYPEFFAIWDRIKYRTRYRVTYNTEVLIKRAASAIGSTMPRTTRPKIVARTYTLKLSDVGVTGTINDSAVTEPDQLTYIVPDIYGYIQSKVSITRNTIYRILKCSGRLEELAINPQLFLDNVIARIKNVLNQLMVDGIKYEQIAGEEYAMQLFENEEIETYLSNLFAVTNTDKTLYNYISMDSAVERKFAEECQVDPHVRFFFKLPRGFKIPTPIGNYNPDWAVVFENDSRIYFVAETKSTLNPELLRGVEQLKIDCGKRHFGLDVFASDGVQFKQITELKELYG